MAMYTRFLYYLPFFAGCLMSVRSENSGDIQLSNAYVDYYDWVNDNKSMSTKSIGDVKKEVLGTSESTIQNDIKQDQPVQGEPSHSPTSGDKDKNSHCDTIQTEVLMTSESPIQNELKQVSESIDTIIETPIQDELVQWELRQLPTPGDKYKNSHWGTIQTEVPMTSKSPFQNELKQISYVKNNIKIDKLIITPIIIPPLPWSQLYATTPQQKMAKVPGEFDNFQEKWRALLVSDKCDETNSALINYLRRLSKRAEYLYGTINTSVDRTYLWPIEQKDTFSADLTRQFQKLQILSVAYGTNGTTYYKDPKILSAVKGGLDFMVKPGKYDGEKYRGNWWDWQVGVPTMFIDILMVIKNELPLHRIQKYTKVINSYVPDPYHLRWTEESTFVDVASAPHYEGSVAQRTPLARTILGLGILQNNITKISLSLDSIVEVFKPVTKDDGFYQDGSFVQHKNIPYTGLFGNTLVHGLGEILAISKGSKYEIATDLVQSLVESIEQAFLPLIYRGETIATVNGLSISRPWPPNKDGYGSETMYNLLMITKSSSDKHSKKLKESVKYWIQQNPEFYLSNARTYNDLSMTISLLNDSTIIGDTLPFTGTKMYASMDRFVQRTSNYMLGLSLYSKRVSAFEAGNHENKRGWHTADGVLYLYNDDDVQFGNDYWPTVDPYRLPGTTVDTRHLSDEVSAYCNFPSDETWVGGVANFNQGVVGMSLNKAGFMNNWETLSMDLIAKKSWFIVDGQIVALGAGITGTTEASIETIIDNRLLNYQYTYDVVSNHGNINATMENLEIDWLLLKSDHQRASIGYYFPNGQNVTVISETRTGTYNDINGMSPSHDEYTGDYRKFIIDHGQRPVNATYAYVLLPGIHISELLDKYSNSIEKPVKILENSVDIQAVEITSEGYLGINIWREIGGEIEGISCNKPVSLMRKTKGIHHTYILSDPTQSNNAVTLQIPDFSKLVTLDEGIYYDVEYNEFVVNFTNAGGASKEFTVENISKTRQ